MIDDSDMSAAAKIMYQRSGLTTVEIAAVLVENDLTIYAEQVRRMLAGERTYRDLSHVALARRLVGTLLDAGWTPPEPKS